MELQQRPQPGAPWMCHTFVQDMRSIFFFILVHWNINTDNNWQEDCGPVVEEFVLILDYNCQSSRARQGRNTNTQIGCVQQSSHDKPAWFSYGQGKPLFRSSSSSNSYIGSFSSQLHFQTQLIAGPVLLCLYSLSLELQFFSSNSPIYILKHLTNSFGGSEQSVNTVYLECLAQISRSEVLNGLYESLLTWDSLGFCEVCVIPGQALCPYNSIAENLTERTGKRSTDVNQMLKEALCIGKSYSSTWQQCRCITAITLDIAVSIDSRHFILMFLLFHLSKTKTIPFSVMAEHYHSLLWCVISFWCHTCSILGVSVGNAHGKPHSTSRLGKHNRVPKWATRKPKAFYQPHWNWDGKEDNRSSSWHPVPSALPRGNGLWVPFSVTSIPCHSLLTLSGSAWWGTPTSWLLLWFFSTHSSQRSAGDPN